MKREIFLHIGVHKTGTTSFQRSLRINKQRLIEMGIRPISELNPDLADGNPKTQNARRFNLACFAHCFVRYDLLDSPAHYIKSSIQHDRELLSSHCDRHLRETLSDRLPYSWIGQFALS